MDTPLFAAATVASQAARFFSIGFEAAADDSFRLTSHGASAVFRIVTRSVTAEDLAAAERAEARGRAGGMSALARRCAYVWRIEPPEGAPPWLVLECCALLASVALGPVLPPDESTLFGVRGARERAEKLRVSG